MKAATLIKMDGTQQSVLPSVKKSKFVLEELRKFVGGSIGLIHIRDGEVLVVNEDGLNLKLPPNREATNLMIERLGAVRASIVTGELLVLSGDEVKAHIANLGPSPTVKPLVGNVLHCRLSQVD
jgi:hypothetical protein